MKIFGMQKLTLIDYPGRVACTLFTGGCNFMCPFCHNSGLVIRPDATDSLDEKDVLEYLDKRRGVLDGVCISGGEPLLQPQIESFITKIKGLGYAVKLDTNGSFSDRLRHIVESGLVDYVAMDIKNSLDKYPQTIGVDGFDTAEIQKSAAFLMNGSVDYEFRTTVVAELHCAQSFESIGAWLAGAKRYYLQQFSDSGNIIKDGMHACSFEQMTEYCNILKSFIPSVELREMK